MAHKPDLSFPSIAILVLSSWACGNEALAYDFGAGFFPELSPSVRSQACLRGAAIPPASITGAIATTDCPIGPGLGYLDAYRVRVGDSATVSFDVESDFDSQLELFRIDDLDDYIGSAVWLAYDDDSGEGRNARLSHDLVPLTEYMIRIAGADDFSRGAYTLRITP